MVTRNCNECQVEYEAEQRYLNRGQGLFCSRTCSAAYHAEAKRVKHEPNTMCSWCGIDFYRKPSAKKSKSDAYYCSREHQSLGAKNSQTHHSGPAKNPNSRSRKGPCTVCSEELPEKTNSTTQMHVRCKKIYLRAYNINSWLSGDNSVTLNRSRTTGQPVDTKRFVKEYLLDTRGDSCEDCGFDKHGPHGSIIQMDHINGNCFDNRIENLKLLCPNCHAMTETYGSRNKGSGRAHRRK